MSVCWGVIYFWKGGGSLGGPTASRNLWIQVLASHNAAPISHITSTTWVPLKNKHPEHLAAVTVSATQIVHLTWYVRATWTDFPFWCTPLYQPSLVRRMRNGAFYICLRCVLLGSCCIIGPLHAGHISVVGCGGHLQATWYMYTHMPWCTIMSAATWQNMHQVNFAEHKYGSRKSFHTRLSWCPREK